MFPLSALLAHAELKTRAKRGPTETPSDGRSAVRVTRYGNLTLFPLVEQGELVRQTDPFAPGESLSEAEVIDAVWEEPRVVASISNVSTSGVGLILNDELPTGLQFDVDWVEGSKPGPIRFEVVHTKPLQAGMFRTGAKLIAGEIPEQEVPTPFVRRFELASLADEQPAPQPAPVPEPAPMKYVAADEPTSVPETESPYAPLTLVRDGVMSLSRVPMGDAPDPDRRAAPEGTFNASLAGGFEKTERLDGSTVCGWERSIEMRREGHRMWIYVHTSGKKNGWGLYVDADQFERAVNRIQLNAGSPFVATTLAA